jgi:quercetin dioxygenase-like cupin family protein
MAKLTIRRFSTPDEVRPFQGGTGRAEILTFGEASVGRGIFQPGWKWSKHVGPIAGTASCEVAHSGYCVSGRMHLVMDDGVEAEVGPGDYAMIPPGHDAWVVGGEPCVFLDFAGMAGYAQPAREARREMGSGGGERPGAHH